MPDGAVTPDGFKGLFYFMPLTIKDGKFYRDGVIEAPEHGNIDQIKLMNDILRERELLKTDGVEVDVEVIEVFKCHVSYKCACGRSVAFKEIETDDEFYHDEFAGQKFKCKCGNKYILAMNEENDLVIKLV